MIFNIEKDKVKIISYDDLNKIITITTKYKKEPKSYKLIDFINEKILYVEKLNAKQNSNNR